ncbi:MAG: hypothetical protein LAT67_10585 [Balneolales bacterium]|nr:hypothetical protein [Balneolales bacterium]
MKIAFTIITFLLFLSSTSSGQDIDSLNAKIAELNDHVKAIDEQIKHLQEQRNSLITHLSELNKIVAQIRYKELISEGVPTKISFVGARMRAEPSGGAQELARIESGKEVLIFDFYKPPFFKAQYADLVGYISVASLEVNDFIEEKQNELNGGSTRGQNTTQRQDRLVRQYGLRDGIRIYRKEPWIGMTSVMAREAFGRPNNINRTTTISGTLEQWVYQNRIYLYFRNGILDSFQELQ